MRPRLMFPDADFSPAAPDTHHDLVEDLELHELWDGMARGDGRLHLIARTATLTPLTDPAAITHRQDVLADCLRDTTTARALYDLAEQAVTADQQITRVGARNPEVLLNQSLRALELFCGHLRRLSAFTAEHAHAFGSAALTRLCRLIREQLTGEYLGELETLLRRIGFDHGIIATAHLGEGNKSVGFRLQEPPSGKGRGSAAHRRLKRSGLSCTIRGQYEADWRALTSFRGRVLQVIADAATESAGNVRGFFTALRDELGFYIGCLNLAETLAESGLPICLPTPRPPAERALTAQDLHEPCLALRRRGPTVGNDITADATDLIVITGANGGGKTTFLRSVGVAHLMMQSGMFVTARALTASVTGGLHTHFRREEDHAMASGKLEEELIRMSAVADALHPGDLLLCNESFMSTNEREGSTIAAEIVQALTDSGVRVLFVTHLHDFAHRMLTERPARSLFLLAARGENGQRPFRLTPGAPSPTAHAADLYARIFGEPLDRPAEDRPEDRQT
ncbi:hypothetical protein OG417_28935 [Actinoallomurus sp. NBC_01490]|uniref:MutS-related protein n=1 Tax=Actinoallomurus sp. NBC_01490 TaxID=2903557 RepID=UPI002E3263AD|nr:hypothetical protein [Actinoallomurus sp. NBC_01490]